MKSFFVFCVLKFVTALAQKTNGEINEGHKKHGADGDIFKDDNFIFNGDKDIIPYMVQTPLKHQNYNQLNSKQENKVERHKMIIENNLPFSNLEDVRYDPANVETGTGQRRRNSNSNSGVNINNNVSDNKEGVEINNIQQENKKSDSKLKANFIEWINNSYLQNYTPDKKSDSDSLSQEYIEDEESSNANNDVNINNNVNNNLQKVQINNVQQKNELNRRRMNINSNLNANLFKKNIGNSYLETNEENQSSVINFLPFNGHTRRNVNSNVNSDVNINNDVHNNLDKIDLDNIQQNNEINWRRMDLQSTLNTQISPKNNKNSQVQHKSVNQISLNSYPSQGPIRRKVNSNVNSGININNDIHDNLDKIELDNIQQKNEQTSRIMDLQYALNAQTSPKNNKNGQIRSNSVNQISLNSYPSQGPTRRKVNSNVNSGININNDIHDNWDKIELDNIQQKNEQTRRIIDLQSALNAQISPKNNKNGQIRSNSVNQISLNSYPSQGPTRRNVNSNVNSGININNDVYGNLDKVQLENIQQKNEENNTDLSKENKENEQEVDLLALLSPKKNLPEKIKVNINKKLNINNNLNHNVQKVIISNINQKNKENIKKMNVQSILSYFSYFVHHPPKDKNLNALKRKKETYMIMLSYFIKYLGEMGVPDSEILYYIEQAQSYESDAEIREIYNKLIHSYQNPSQNPDIDDRISETPVTIVPDRPEEVNPDDSNPEDEGNIRDKNIQLILNNFDHLLHNAPKDENLSALRQKKKTYLLELIDYIRYLEAIGVPDSKILWYLQEAQKYESDEELKEKYNTLIHSYQNPSQNPGIDEILSETPVTIIPDRPEEINPDESNLEDGESISDKNIQLILSKFNHFLRNSPKDEDLVALKQRRKTYLLELINFIKYLEAIGIPDLKILWYLQEAQKYESDEELREKYNTLIHSYQNPSQNPGIDDILSETPVTIIPDRPEEINPDESNLEDGESISDKNIQLILSKFNHFLRNSPKDEDLVALKQRRKTYLIELINFIKYLEAIGVPDLKILWYLQEAQKYESDEELREKYKNLIHSYQNPSQNPGIDDILSETPVTIIPDRPEEINPENGESVSDKNIQLILSKFNHFLHNSPKDEDLVALKQKRKTYLLQLINFIKYLEAIGVPDLKILWYLQEAQKYESDEELREKYNTLIHSYQNSSQNPDIDDEISETPVTIIPDRPEEINPDASNLEDGESISDKNIQLILSKFNHFLHNSPKDEDLVALKQKRKTYLLELINFLKYLEAIGVPDLKILWYLQEARKYEFDEELREIYKNLMHSYQNPDVDDIISETPVTIIPDRPEEINPDESNPEDGENINDKNIQLILSKFNHFLHNSPKDEDLVALKQKRKTYLLQLINFIKYLEVISVPDSKILLYLQEAQKYESDEELKVIYLQIIHSYEQQQTNGNKKPSPPSEEILPNNITEKIEKEPEHNNGSNTFRPTEKNDNDMDTEAPTPDETTPHWKPEDIPTPYWEPESTPPPHWEPENTPAPHWEPENTPPPCWAPENEPIPSSTEIPIVNPPNILDLLNPPYNVHLNKYVDDTITYLIQHLKRNGVSNEEIQKIVQMSLINVIKSMTQYTISEYQGKILNEIRHNLQSSLYRYMLLKCCHTMN